MELSSALSLRTALPYLRLFRNRLFVVKIGGEALQDRRFLALLIEQLMILHQLGIHLILVHGGGPQATEIGSRLGVESEFIDGRRLTSLEFIETMVLALNGAVRTEIVARCRAHKLNAVGMSGIDSGLIRASKRKPIKVSSGEMVDFGWVGEIEAVDPAPLRALLSADIVPVVSSLAADDQGQVLNINADSVASAIAVEIGASKLILVTKPRGLLDDIERPETLISHLTIAELKNLEDSGVIKSGMLPKSKAIQTALEGGVERVHLISFEYPESILTELFTNEGCGTMITHD